MFKILDNFAIIRERTIVSIKKVVLLKVLKGLRTKFFKVSFI